MAVLRLSGGRLMSKLLGLNMLLLSSTGNLTGRLTNTPLLYIEYGDNYYCAASFGGNDKNPQWFQNLIAEPNVGLLIRRKHIPAIAHMTSGEEREQAWAKLVDYHPPFAQYQERTERVIPVVKFTPSPGSETICDRS